MRAAERLSLEDYLATEPASEHKREFVNGEIYAMAGAEPEHNAVREALAALVWMALRGRPCQSFSADQRVYLHETGLYCYPDLVVVCGRPEFVDPSPRSLKNPAAVFEVLSPSTESWDRGGKFAHMRQRPSLQLYALLDPATRRVEWYTRGPDGSWVYREAQGSGPWPLSPLDVTLDLAAVFAQLEALEAAEA
jgi:Uma2 family endonuclease